MVGLDMHMPKLDVRQGDIRGQGVGYLHMLFCDCEKTHMEFVDINADMNAGI